MKKRLISFVPILLFAGLLALMQWISGMSVTSLWWKTILICGAAAVLGRLLPWRRWAMTSRRGSALYAASLFAIIVGHFAGVLLQEGRRALTARSLGIGRRYGPGWFRSLVFAVNSLFVRAAVRAERFYAAQLVRGIGE